jgi:hypothetical protein
MKVGELLLLWVVHKAEIPIIQYRIMNELVHFNLIIIPLLVRVYGVQVLLDVPFEIPPVFLPPIITHLENGHLIFEAAADNLEESVLQVRTALQARGGQEVLAEARVKPGLTHNRIDFALCVLLQVG